MKNELENDAAAIMADYGKEEIMYVYIQSEPSLWTVGFYEPNGKWIAESDHRTEEAAAERVHYLNSRQSLFTYAVTLPGWAQF